MAYDIDKLPGFERYDLIDTEEFQSLDQSSILGDETVLKNEVFDKAFEKILEKHKPKNKAAFIALCTYSRPYSTSPKWKKYLKDFKNVDFLVGSNGGVIPEEFWEEALFLTYDAPQRGSKAEAWAKEARKLKDLEGSKRVLVKEEVDNLYKMKFYNRLIKFFKTFRYDYVIGDFVKTQRNFEPFILAMELLKDEGYIKYYDHCGILTDIYDEEERKNPGRSYPTLSHLYYNRLKEKIEKVTN